MSAYKVAQTMREAQRDVLDILLPPPVATFDLRQVADIIRDMSGSWEPAKMLHDCDMEVELDSEGRLSFCFYPKSARRAYCVPAYAKAR
jgi:hypothetical protein